MNSGERVVKDVRNQAFCQPIRLRQNRTGPTDVHAMINSLCIQEITSLAFTKVFIFCCYMYVKITATFWTGTRKLYQTLLRYRHLFYFVQNT